MDYSGYVGLGYGGATSDMKFLIRRSRTRKFYWIKGTPGIEEDKDQQLIRVSL